MKRVAATFHPLVFMSVMRSLFEAKTAITARSGTRMIQVDEDLGVTKRTSSTITNCLSAMNDSDGFVGNELHGTEWIGLELQRCLLEARA